MRAQPTRSFLAGLLALLTAASAQAATPRLVQAVKNGDRATALTLARDANEVAAAEADGTTALHWAVRAEDIELVDRMLEEFDATELSALLRFVVAAQYSTEAEIRRI